MFDGAHIGKLGFGCMRFEGHETDSVDFEYTCKMIDHFMAHGGNYFDTAWAYPHSESTLRKVLVERYPRDSYTLTTKCVAWVHCQSTQDLENQLQESLSDLGVDYVDIYLMHNLGGNRTATFEAVDGWNFVKSVKERGLAKHIGFSAHCTPEELEGFFAAYPEAEVVQLQINYADWDNPSFRARECVEVANRHGVPIIAMEPIKGGLLADPSDEIKAALAEGMPDDSPATAALRFASSAPGVITSLSGMSTMEMVEENCSRFEHFQPLSEEERAAVQKAQDIMSSSKNIPCTGCNYCQKVCPQNIGISGCMSALNYYITFGDAQGANGQLGFIVPFAQSKKLPTECIRCGACVEACPQRIPILECFDRVIADILPFQGPEKHLMR